MTAPTITIPAEAPVMVLPNALLFPHALMPLHIFEPRYRAMLRWALEHDRMFCIALMKPGVSEAETPGQFFHTAGLGLVRACVGREDGTSHLMLHGLARVRFTGFTQLAPFRIAQIEGLPSMAGDEDETGPLSDEVRGLCAKFRDMGFELPERIEEFLAKMRDPDVLADSVAHSFIRSTTARQQLLEEQDVTSRLRETIRYLRSELGGEVAG